MNINISNRSTQTIYSRLWAQLSIKRRKELLYITLFTLLTSVLDVLNFGIIFPFVSIVSNGGVLEQDIYVLGFSVNNLVKLSGILNISILLITVLILSGLSKIFLLKLTTISSFGISSDWSIKMYENLLKQGYEKFYQKNSADIIPRVTQKSSIIAFYFVIPIINIFSSTFFSIAIISVLIYLSPVVTILTFLFLGFVYFILTCANKKKLYQDSINIGKTMEVKQSILQQTFGGFRDLLISNSRDRMANEYVANEYLLRDAQSSSQYISFFPKPLLEYLGVIVLIICTLFLTYSSSASSVLPTITLIALGAQKLLPNFQQIYSASAAIKTGYSSILDGLDLLELEHDTFEESNVGDSPPLEFNNLKFDSINFKYELGVSPVLNGISFEINRGDFIGVIGSSGSGKSTLIDILLGLLKPSSGRVLLNGSLGSLYNNSKWQSTVTHVPQDVYIYNGTLEYNITFSNKLTNEEEIRYSNALEYSMLIDFLGNCMFNSNNLGENGSSISGGQKQRIAIARAIYENKSILFLDECTSALDSSTEQKVLSNIKKLGKTIIMITHNEDNLSLCNKIFKLNQGLCEKIL